jgi:hypothetical protein
MKILREIWLALVVVTVIAACTTSRDTPSKEPSPSDKRIEATYTPTERSTATETQAPTPTPSKTLTSTPSSTPIVMCSLDNTLRAVKDAVKFSQFAVHFNIIEDPTLVVWIVEPALNPQATGDAIQENLEVAMRSGATASYQVRNADSCVDLTFATINPVVVDSQYNGWFSGTISISDVPTVEMSMDELYLSLDGSFEIGYSRIDAAIPQPSTTCTWPEAKAGIERHFAPDRENVAFYYVIDDFGPNVWAQWDGPVESAYLTPTILNVLMELQCFNPQANVIFIVVDDEGYADLVGLIPELDLEKANILYMRE